MTFFVAAFNVKKKEGITHSLAALLSRMINAGEFAVSGISTVFAHNGRKTLLKCIMFFLPPFFDNIWVLNLRFSFSLVFMAF